MQIVSDPVGRYQQTQDQGAHEIADQLVGERQIAIRDVLVGLENRQEQEHFVRQDQHECRQAVALPGFGTTLQICCAVGVATGQRRACVADCETIPALLCLNKDSKNH